MISFTILPYKDQETQQHSIINTLINNLMKNWTAKKWNNLVEEIFSVFFSIKWNADILWEKGSVKLECSPSDKPKVWSNEKFQSMCLC